MQRVTLRVTENWSELTSAHRLSAEAALKGAGRRCQFDGKSSEGCWAAWGNEIGTAA
jgi:hypothetical protein